MRRMKREGEEGEEDKCLWLKEECEGRGGRRGGQICEVERVHVRRMRREEGRRNVCSGEGPCEKDEGGGGEVKYVRWRGSM